MRRGCGRTSFVPASRPSSDPIPSRGPAVWPCDRARSWIFRRSVVTRRELAGKTVETGGSPRDPYRVGVVLRAPPRCQEWPEKGFASVGSGLPWTPMAPGSGTNQGVSTDHARRSHLASGSSPDESDLPTSRAWRVDAATKPPERKRWYLRARSKGTPVRQQGSTTLSSGRGHGGRLMLCARNSNAERCPWLLLHRSRSSQVEQIDARTFLKLALIFLIAVCVSEYF